MHLTPDFTGLLAESLTKEYGIKNITFGRLISDKAFSRCQLSMKSQFGEDISGTLTIQKDHLRPHKFNFDITAVVPSSILMGNLLVASINEIDLAVTLNFLRPLKYVYQWVNNSVGANLIEGRFILENRRFTSFDLNVGLQFSLNVELHPRKEDIQQRKVLMYLCCIKTSDRLGVKLSYQNPFTLNEYTIKNEIDIEQFKLQLLKCYLDAYSYLTNKKLILSSDELDTITYSGLVDYLKIQSMHDIV